MAKQRVKQVDVSAAVATVIDSDSSTRLAALETNYMALVTEVFDEHQLEGTILYIPGISYKTLQQK